MSMPTSYQLISNPAGSAPASAELIIARLLPGLPISTSPTSLTTAPTMVRVYGPELIKNQRKLPSESVSGESDELGKAKYGRTEGYTQQFSFQEFLKSLGDDGAFTFFFPKRDDPNKDLYRHDEPTYAIEIIANRDLGSQHPNSMLETKIEEHCQQIRRLASTLAADEELAKALLNRYPNEILRLYQLLAPTLSLSDSQPSSASVPVEESQYPATGDLVLSEESITSTTAARPDFKEVTAHLRREFFTWFVSRFNEPPRPALVIALQQWLRAQEGECDVSLADLGRLFLGLSELREGPSAILEVLVEAYRTRRVHEKFWLPDAGVLLRLEAVPCGKETCQSDPDEHGPYWYSYRLLNGRIKEQYHGTIRPADDSFWSVERACEYLDGLTEQSRLDDESFAAVESIANAMRFLREDPVAESLAEKAEQVLTRESARIDRDLNERFDALLKKENRSEDETREMIHLNRLLSSFR